MSIDLVDYIHVRLREEIDRCGISLAAASRAAGESSPQRLKEVVSGRQKCPADLVAKLAVIGVDAQYVLIGERGQGARPPSLAPDEELLLDGYRALDAASKKRMLASLISG
ncbi:helix-turn-helix transcriptional regulator [Pseudomonas sp. Pf153]|uniref:helix-turn-helix domain-containing protein n=1 Tax=Pseudomonas sp. Pf153 TaxID=1699309 RepID=UPI00069F3816|nr:helix-turn-helix transcriptional regulator [Pseudomonas sp. Pf153]